MRVGFFPSFPLPALASLLGVAALLASTRAEGYCRTTTCNTADDPECAIDRHGCTNGIPLHWASPCLYYGVQQDGSQRREIDASVASELMVQSFDTWMTADCGSGHPPFVSQSIGEVSCNKPEFNCDTADHNSNTVMFRDDTWRYDPAALAITTLTVDVRDGTILDADMEVNSFGFDFSVGDSLVNNDLLSVLTHESGHFLGLDHTDVDEATMFPGYSSHETAQRTLDQDDISGICEIYPPDRSTLSCDLEVPSSTECVGGSECRSSSGDGNNQTNSCNLSTVGSHTPAGRLCWFTFAGLALLPVLRRRRSVSHRSR